METDDRHYFFEGLFIIVFTIAGALLFAWFGTFEHGDDVLYRIRFSESVSGLTVGDPVKYRGVDVGTVKAMRVDPDDSRLVQVDVKIGKDTPVTTETKATLTMKGITGSLSVELTGGSPKAKSLVLATPSGEVPVIASEKSKFGTFFDELPKVMNKLSGLETQAQKVLSDVGDVTKDVKEDPSLLLRGRRKKN
jgi:phospholipid/cholesterol/gamma-HCH transport system substrate-binding protein